MSIEIKDGAVLKDGKHVGTVAEDGIFTPAAGVHHKTIESVRKELTGGDAPPEEKPKAEKTPEPIKSAQFGDLTPEYVEWYRANHTTEEFAAKYHNRGIF